MLREWKRGVILVEIKRAMRVVFENQIDDLSKVKWTFYAQDMRLYLDGYAILKRETKRKGWKPLSKYDRLLGRSNSISEDEVPLTEEIKYQAHSVFMHMMAKTVVCKWSDRNK